MLVILAQINELFGRDKGWKSIEVWSVEVKKARAWGDDQWLPENFWFRILPVSTFSSISHLSHCLLSLAWQQFVVSLLILPNTQFYSYKFIMVQFSEETKVGRNLDDLAWKWLSNSVTFSGACLKGHWCFSGCYSLVSLMKDICHLRADRRKQLSGYLPLIIYLGMDISLACSQDNRLTGITTKQDTPIASPSRLFSGTSLALHAVFQLS